MKRITINLLILGALLTGAFSLGAQQPDSLLASRIRADCQYPLTRDKSAPGYSKQAMQRCIARADSIVALHKTPPPPPPPPPPDSVVVVNDSTAGIAMRAELPRVTPVFAVPAPVRSYLVTGGLQAALDTAKRGDEIRLSGTFTGNYVLRGCAPGWIVVTSNGTLPAAGVRVRPADAPQLPRIQSTNTDKALRTDPGACRWVLRGLDIYGALETATTVSYGILALGAGGDEGQTTLASVPAEFLLERSWIHGAPSHNNTRCVVLNSAATIVRDSWISDCHARGFDSQAIEGWNGPGPYLIENNYVEGAGENIMFGGADPGISGLSPSDITIRRNHITKPLSWRSGPWSVKNLFELKNARRVLLESNVFENSWPASQEGMAIVIKSSQDACGTCLWEGTQDVTFRWNIVRNAAVGLNIQGYDESGQVKTTTHTARVAVTHNAFTEIGAEGRAALMLLTHDLADIRVDSNVFTHAAPRGTAVTFDYSGGAARRMSWTDNVMTVGNPDNGGVLYSGGAVGTAALQQMVGDGSWWFAGNQVVGGAPLASRFPPGNTFPDTVPAVDLGELQRRTAGVVVSP